jgi:hypothetical protein
VAYAKSACPITPVASAPGNRTQTKSSGGPTASGSVRSTPSTTRTSQNPPNSGPAGVLSGPVTSGKSTAWRMRSGSTALRSTSERVQRRSSWRTVTVALARARPVCMASTSISSGLSMAPPRANTVWIVFTSLEGSMVAPATIDWARSCPPKTTPPGPSEKFCARKRPSPTCSRSRTPSNSDSSATFPPKSGPRSRARDRLCRPYPAEPLVPHRKPPGAIMPQALRRPSRRRHPQGEVEGRDIGQ